MSNSIILYHGSEKIIKKPIFGVGNPKNDYGLGFYCTENLELAKEWACAEETDGYANKYVLDTTELSVLSLTSGEYNILNWLSVLLENRTFHVGSDIAIEAKKYILERFSLDYKKFDLLKGYRADDSYFSFATAFLNNTISIAQLEKAMALGKLGEQVVAMSKKAFEALTFEEAFVAQKDVYFPLKIARDTKAREEFRKEKQKNNLLDGKYILDIMREEWGNDDERLQRIVLR